MAQPIKEALLPISGDPVVATFWWLFFPRWSQEIDRLYVYVGNDVVPLKILDYLARLFNHPLINFKVLTTKDQGEALRTLVVDSNGPLLMLIEEDAFIFKEGAVKEQFDRLISGECDFIGSPRDSVCQELREVEIDRFGKKLDQRPFDFGPNFWPNFVFTKKDLLMKTDLHFLSKHWKKGDHIKELDYTMKEDGSGDTFSWMSIQIRNLTKKIGYVPQYKAYPIDPFLERSGEWTFSGASKWIHAGSLSSGVVQYLMDEKGYPLFDPHVKHEVGVVDHEDFVMRTAWWHLALEHTGRILEQNGLKDFANEYAYAIHRLMDAIGITDKEMHERMHLYDKLLF